MNSSDVFISVMFYLFAFIIIVSASLSIFANRIIYSLIFAVINFFTVGFVFLFLSAEYNAVVQFSVYGVAVPILLIMAIMFTSYKADKNIYLSFTPRFIFTVISSILFVLTLFNILLISSSVIDWLFTPQSSIHINSYEMFNAISTGLYIKYLFAFELFAVLVLLVIVGLSTLITFRENKHG